MLWKDKLRAIKKDWKNTFPYRPYFNRNKCIFIHIPKTAGTSILSCLAQGKQFYRDHATWFDYYKYNPIKFNNYYKFTFVRNPYARLKSVYQYLMRGGNKGDDLILKEHLNKVAPNFERFVCDFLNEHTIYEHVLFMPQYLFIYNWKLNLKVDFIGYYETLEEDFRKIVTQTKCGGSRLQKLNNSPLEERNYCEYFKNTEVIENIAKLYARDFELLRYSCDPLI